MTKRGLSRKELEEIKKREEIEAAAEVINKNSFGALFIYLLSFFLLKICVVSGL